MDYNETKNMNTLGQKIRKRRLKLGWSLDVLAQKSRISKAYLSQLETGDSDRPSAKILYNIAIALDISIADLLGKKLKIQEKNRQIPKSLEQAAIQHGWSEEDIEMLSGLAFRAQKDKRNLSPEDWFLIYAMFQRSGKK